MYSKTRWYDRCGQWLVGRALCLILLAACATQNQNMFVLIPDLEGEVGRITVTNQAGSQVLEDPRQASTVRSADDAPSPPVTIEEPEISRIFGAALAVQPAGPARFILYFRENTEDLTPESEALLPEVLRTIQDRSATAVSIIGHADTVGDRGLNSRLSLGRARKVADLVEAQGIDPKIVEIESHGEDNPLVKTGDEVREPRNRRVEITVW
ncbi:MAG: OmpA family protein [Deltaproteobacteria bacterium]|nr:OmpA family protein [Deltaproteobacteria bacterium]